MRVLILGPVINDKTSGGVGAFDETLFDGFSKIGDCAQIISINKSSKIDNFVVGNGRKKPNSIFFLFNRIGNIIKDFQPDLVISSLQYSLGIKKYRKKWKKATYIQVLHGYPCPINGRAKALLVNKAASFSRKHFDYLVTVSYISYAINKQINCVQCDKIIHNGIDLKYKNDIPKDKKYDFIYIGRLHNDKGVEMIGRAFLMLKKSHPNLNVAIGGYGDLEYLFKNGDLSFENSGIEFLGKISHDDVANYLSNSKFFVSLAPNEAFGIALAEAVVNGCNICTQITAGITSLFYDKPYFHNIESLNSQQLFARLDEILLKYSFIADNERLKMYDYLSSTRMALEYKSLLSGFESKKE